MKTSETAAEKDGVTGEIRCNLCGEECRSAAFQRSHAMSAMLKAKVTGGYDNCFPGDGERWMFDLCEACVAAVVSIFKIPPKHSTFCWATGVDDPPHGSASLDLLRDGPAPGEQEFRREAYLRAMQRRAAMQSADVDPLAALKKALATIPERGRLIPDGTLQRIEALVFGAEGEEFNTELEAREHDRPDTTDVTLSDGTYVATVRECETVREAGLHGVLTMMAWEVRHLRRLLTAVLESVDDETRAKIEAAVTVNT